MRRTDEGRQKELIMSKEMLTVGEWYQGLPRWRKSLFDFLCVVVGDIRAIEWCGYHRVQAKGSKQ